MTYENGKILVFARTPERGSVKTRLQPLLGEEGCYKLHKSLVSGTLKTVSTANLAAVEVWHTGNPECDFWQQQGGRYSFVLKEQQGFDLGERMSAAFSRTFGNDSLMPASEKPEWAILIGSDCPEISADYLAEAACLLQSGEPVVIGPAEDGGYVLIGLRQPKEYLFDGIHWGTCSVLDETLNNASKHHCKVHLMKPLRDLDVEEDLAYFRGTVPFF